MTESTQEPRASAGTSPADADGSDESAMPDQASVGEVGDEQLPEDLQPGEENPLAEPLDPDDDSTKSREELAMDETQEGLGNDDGASKAPDQAGTDQAGTDQDEDASGQAGLEEG